MAKGKPNPGGKLVPYSSKVTTELKALLDAVVLVQRLEGQRELLECMTKLYETAYPQDFAAAREMVKLLEGIRPADTPQAGGQ